MGTLKQVAIVTGGASGIGLALGAALVSRGWYVVLADISDVQAKEHAHRLTRAAPGTAVAAVVDVRDADAVAAVVQSTHREHGRLDLMVNNAGIGIRGEPDELLMAHWDAVIDTNLRGVVHGCHAAYPIMKAQGRGTILNTASIEGLIPGFGQTAPYSAAKHGVVGLSLALRAAGAEYGVQVNVLCPGVIDTAALDGEWPEGLPIPPSFEAIPSLRESLLKSGIEFYPADRLAEDTLKGLEKNKPILIIPRKWRRFWLLARYAPNLAIRVAEEGTARMRKGLVG